MRGCLDMAVFDVLSRTRADVVIAFNAMFGEVHAVPCSSRPARRDVGVKGPETHLRVQEYPGDEFQCQNCMNFRSIVSVAIEMAVDYCFQLAWLHVIARQRQWVE